MHETCPICQSSIASGLPACPACGFHLSGATQSFSPVNEPVNPVEVLITPAPEVQEPISAPVLRMVRGPQRGAEYKLSPDKTTIGRNPHCDIFLNDMTVSRAHAIISKTQDAFIIADDQSYNGVWVNNRSVNQKTLEQGDFVQIGRFGFIFDTGE